MAADDHGELLVQVAHETVAASEIMQRVVPHVPMTSPVAKHLHELVYTVSTIETLVHQFIDRELLDDAANHPAFRRRESGAKLQDTLERMRDAPLKPAVKASLLSGGIASLLYLFAILLRDLNVALGTVPRVELATASHLSSAVSALTAAAAGCALQLSAARTAPRGVLATPRHRRLLGRALIGTAAAVGMRAVVSELARRRTAKRLGLSADRLNLTLRLWCLATSVLQRAHRQGVSYIQLQGLEASNVKRVASSASLSLHGLDDTPKLPLPRRSGSNSSFTSPLYHDANGASGGGGAAVGAAGGMGAGAFGGLVRTTSGMNLTSLPAAGSNSRDHAGMGAALLGGAAGSDRPGCMLGSPAMCGLRASASYLQLIAQPGLHDIDTSEMNPTRVMFDLCAESPQLRSSAAGGARAVPLTPLARRVCAVSLETGPPALSWPLCVPWSDSAFWWRFNPILDATKRVMDTYMAAMLRALRAVAAADLPVPTAYVLALPLLVYFAARPSAAAAEVWSGWWEPDMLAYQAIYAPLSWPLTTRLVMRTVGRDILHEERTLAGRRVVTMQTKRAAELWAVRCRQAAARGEPSPERPTIFFVPGGAFICDFEAADYFFLHRWVRQTEAIVVYVSYDYAPQVPYPGPMLCVLRAYRALRSHDHALGFRASPVIVAGLSAGGNLAMSAMLAPLLVHHAPPSLAEELAAPGRHPAGQGARGAPAIGGAPSPSLAGNGDATEPFLMPDAILLLCPVLNLCRSPSPSRVVFASDVLLPQPMLKAFATAYDSDSDHWKVRDPLLSPVFAPDETLKQLPPVTLLCGGLDPLLDDSVDFNTRIRRMGVPGELHIYRSLPHTFVSFPHWHILPEVEAALATTVRHIRSVCMRGQPPLDDPSSRSDESVASDSEDNGFAHLGSTDHQTDSDPLEGLN